LLQHSITVAERDRRIEAARIEEAEAQKRRNDEELRRWEAEQAHRAEKERVAALIGEIERWRKTADIRAYVNAAVDVSGADEAWARWALIVADKIDPLTAE